MKDLSRNIVFDILSNERRRWVLQYLFGLADRVTLYALSKELAAWENDVATEEVTSTQRKRLYTALRQVHLPKMDEADIVDFDAARGFIELTKRADGLKVYLEVVPSNEIPWSVYYLGLGALWTPLVGALWIGVEPFTLLPGFAWAGLIVLSFVGSALAHAYSQRKHSIERGSSPLSTVER